MKKIYCLLLILIINSFNVLAQQWEKVDLPSQYASNYWLDIYFLEEDPRYGWVCGYQGKVLRTTDGGETWEGATIFGVNQLESIHFADSKTGYTSGEGYIYKSTDGGRSWRNVTPYDNMVTLWGTYFITPKVGYVIGGICDGRQSFYKTNDGGQTWYEAFYYEPGTKLSDVMMYSEDGLGYASSSGFIWRTTDGGRSWAKFSKTGGNDWQEEITNIGNSFLVPYSEGCDGATLGNGSGGFRFSVDNGKSWRDFRLLYPTYGTFLLDTLRGWGCGLKNQLYYTSDGGKNWVSKNCGIDPGTDLDDIWMVNDSTGWVVGHGVYRMVNKSLILPSISALGPISFCEGDSVVLKLNMPYKNMRWNDNSRADSIVVKKSGDYYCFAYNTFCDSATTKVIRVNVIPKPNVSISASDAGPYCEGDSVRLAINKQYKYIKWSTGETTQSIIVKKSDVYEVTVADSNGCPNTSSFKVEFHPLPIPEITVKGKTNICSGDSVELSATAGYKSYRWYRDKITGVISTNRVIAADVEDNYYVVAVNEFGCEGTSPSQFIALRNDTNQLSILSVEDKGIFSFDTVNYMRLYCKELLIKNQSSKQAIIDKPYLFYKIAFSIPQSRLPIVIEPGESQKLMLCYSATDLGWQLDTLLLPDICNDHYLPLAAYGAPNTYASDSRCGGEINLTTREILSGTNFVANSPLPNPFVKKLTIPIAKAIRPNENNSMNAGIYNQFGELVANGKYYEESIQYLESYNISKGTIEFDLDSTIPSGLYIVKIEYSGNFEYFKVIKE